MGDIKMDKNNICKLADWFENFEPRYGIDDFDMHWTICVDDYGKTSCCIQGCAAAMCNGTIVNLTIPNIWHATNCFLGLTKTQQDELCYPEANIAYKATPKQAAMVLRNFAETGVIDWSIIQ